MANSLVDRTDMKILYHLDVDARQPYSIIAKKLRISDDAVQYRVTRMQKEGIIKGFYAVIDPSALGYLSCRFFIKFHLTTPKMEKEIVDYLVNDPQYWWVDSIDGFRDLGVACWLPNTVEFGKKKEELQEKFRENADIVQESIYSTFYLYSRAYLVGKDVDDAEPVVLCREKKTDVDALDWRILELIGKNARVSSLEIAKKLGITPPTALSRLKLLKQKNIIRRYRPMIDLGKLGYYWYKIEFKLRDYAVKKKMLDFFARHPNIVYAYEAIGGADLEVELEVESYEHFREILDSIKEKFGEEIEDYQHLLWYKEHKITYIPYRPRAEPQS
ncbi:MAG: winged helix-turn-helix transcriptional regulator [Candidatus Micrarchaeota archaeon]